MEDEEENNIPLHAVSGGPVAPIFIGIPAGKVLANLPTELGLQNNRMPEAL